MQAIALIEDDPRIREMYTFKLKKEGYSIVSAENGRLGLGIIKKNKPDLVLLDLKMPVMGGEEMLKEMRSSEWGESIPVIILTNISRDEAPRGLTHLGISDYVVKAMYTPAQVLHIVKRALAKH